MNTDAEDGTARQETTSDWICFKEHIKLISRREKDLNDRETGEGDLLRESLKRKAKRKSIHDN